MKWPPGGGWCQPLHTEWTLIAPVAAVAVELRGEGATDEGCPSRPFFFEAPAAFRSGGLTTATPCPWECIICNEPCQRDQASHHLDPRLDLSLPPPLLTPSSARSFQQRQTPDRDADGH